MSMQIENLSFSYGSHAVLQNIGFSLESGSFVAVLGANGAGKTTLFRCILGLQNGYAGKIMIDGADVRALSARELARHIAYIPQLHGQAFAYTVSDMVLMGTSHGVSLLSVPGKKERAAADRAMERMGIRQLGDQLFSQISGGEQQLVLIARALAQQTHTLIMDEPTASLDYGNQSLVLEQVRSLTKEGYTVLFSTHNPQHALTYVDSVIALLNGGIAAQGPPETAMTPELIERLYGVRAQFVHTDCGILIAPPVVKEGN